MTTKKFDITNLNNVPHLPGCYLWKDENNNVIYIGKAKDLNKRMHQYFSKTHNTRITKLTNSINNYDYIVVNNENEALILENNLIKKYQPIFNVLLKEGSNSYPYILITNEWDPRILYKRKYDPKNGTYYGPFASNDAKAYDLYLYLNKIFPLRKCNVIPKKKCIYYDLKQCLGPCINKIDQNTYIEIKNQIDDLFHNKNKQILQDLKQKELMFAKELNFEQAQQCLKLQNIFDNVIQQQIVELKQKINADYIGYYCNDDYLSINIFNYIDGKLIAKNQIITPIYNDDLEDSIISYLLQYYANCMLPKTIYISLNEANIKLLSNNLNTRIIKPLKGQNFQLLMQAISNSQYFLNKNKNKAIYNQLTICDELAKLINIKKAYYIEMIDNANLFLENSVAGLVVFKNGEPIKSMYRKYNLDTTNNKSDYHYMYEVVLRRYQRLLDNNDPLPDLLIVDGGVNQINAAKKAFQALSINNINLIGLIKNNKHQTDKLMLSNYQLISIDHHSDVFLFLKRIQNEVHNFAINFYRNKNIKSKLSTFLDQINGIGIKTKQKIIDLYPNIYDLKNANLETLKQIVNEKIAKEIIKKINEI